MLRKLRSRLTYANVVATLALFVALGGTGAYAANTVFSTDIVDGEVKSVDIANNSIHSGDVLDNTINTFDVHSFLGVDVVDNTLTGADVQNGSLTGGDLADLTVRGNDIGFNTITGENVLDGSLEDEDLGVAFVNFTARIGTVPAHDCTIGPINGVDAQGDHMLLTPNATTGGGRIVYSVTYADSTENAWLTSCNTWSSAITPGDVRFNLLVIDAG